MSTTEITVQDIDAILQQSWKAFKVYRKLPLKKRAEFMRAIAVEFDALGDDLIKLANQETALPEARLQGEKARTIFQLNSYADACERGQWLEARIDIGDPNRTPLPKPDLRKMLVPLGPVVVYGASNFPFAFSTAGGDTASAFAAGCPVVIKAHSAHARTSALVATAIWKAAKKTNMPEGIFAHVETNSREIGKALIQHPYTKAVGFTGSFTGGMALWTWANERKDPIPVFSEMGSINPVFLMPDKLKQSAVDVAKLYAGSITQSVGQFCTNPGLLIGIESPELQTFINTLGDEIKKVSPGTMLHPGIFKSYVENRANALAQEGVETVAVSEIEPQINQASPTIASASGQAFLNNPVLHKEVFGPYSIVIRCKDIAELKEVVSHLEGQLTASVMATDKDLAENGELMDLIQDICGRFIINGVPTGVEVCLSMQHGGPFPATTDSRFTSVGADAIKRFARPVAFQNWPDQFLPDELKNDNPLGIWRTVNNELKK
jgi:alpha-ketoglutaric semialdehyde dehydrogenase